MMDQMLEKEDQGETVEEEEANIQARHTPPKNPIVFCHGLFGFDILGPASLPPLQISHWRGIREILEANGTEVFITRVPATASIEERARTLQKSIEERFEGRSVNLIGHSMVSPLFGEKASSLSCKLTYSPPECLVCRVDSTAGILPRVCSRSSSRSRPSPPSPRPIAARPSLTM